MENLDAYTLEAIDKAASTNLGLLRDYFEITRHYPDPEGPEGQYQTLDGNYPRPRITLKLVVRKKKEIGFTVYTQATDDGLPRPYTSEFPLEAHSVFQSIQESGIGSIENDIPKACANGTYFNGRLRKKQKGVKHGRNLPEQYYRERQDGKIDESYPDRKWIDCWHAMYGTGDGEEDIDQRSHYKATLVAPITLAGHVRKQLLDPKFVADFAIKLGLQTREVERFLQGFICVDQVDRGFFIEGVERVDMNITYLVADTMSLYLMVRTLLVDYSETVDNAKEVRRRTVQ